MLEDSLNMWGYFFEPRMGNNGLWSVENVKWIVGMYL